MAKHQKITRAQAIHLGLKTYYTGDLCPQGHKSPRYISRNCVKCAQLRSIGVMTPEPIIYTHCEFCEKELSAKDKAMNAASHKRCWKIRVDRGRYKRKLEDSLRICNGDSEFSGIYDEDGERFKDKEYKIPLEKEATK